MTLRLSWVELSPPGGAPRPLLVVGPSLGTSVESLWGACATLLADCYRVVGWDLPGHGRAQPASGFSIADLADGVLGVVDDVSQRAGVRFDYAGVSVGGAVGQQLLLEGPDRVRAAALLCTGPRFGAAAEWTQRAQRVRDGGTGVLRESAPTRWFAPGFVERDPRTADRLLHDLAEVDAESYAAVCEALAGFDVRARLAEIALPVLAVAGAADPATPPRVLRHLATAVQHGRLEVVEGVAHQAPAEAPERVAHLLRELPGMTPSPGPSLQELRARGTRVRREVLGDEHVDRAGEATTDFTSDFQELISSYAWGSIWTRPGLDRRTRSIITLTALVARGHQEELAMHVRAALTNGVTPGELTELFLQTAIYCGVPDANTAFRIAAGVLDEYPERPGNHDVPSASHDSD